MLIDDLNHRGSKDGCMSDMDLSGKERRWLPWLGRNGKFARRWACLRNSGRQARLEKTFAGLAGTRRDLLLT